MNKLPSGWQVNSLSEVCKIIGGNPAPKGDGAYAPEGIPFVKMKDLGKYHLTTNLVEVENRVDKESAKKNHLKLISNGSILLPRSGSVALNHRAILGIDAYMVSHICALEIKNKEFLLAKFLYYYLVTINFETITKKTTGLDAITFEDLGRVKIPLPPLTIQKQIAEILEKTDQAKQKRKEANKLTEQFLQSAFIEMFGDPVRAALSNNSVTIEEVCNIKGGGTPSKSNQEYYKGNIPWVSPKDMKKLYINDAQDKITLCAIEESSTTLIPKGSILMVIRSGILKSKLPVGINLVDVAINQDMKAFSASKIMPEYLLYYFISSERNVLKKVRSTTVDNLNFNDIKKMKIMIPPLLLQQQFAELVQKTETLKEKQKASEKELENLFNSLMQKAFMGELVS